MSNCKPRKDAMKALMKKNESLLCDYNYFDRTDTVSIASMQSSIFDLDSSLTSNNMEKLKVEETIFENKITKTPYKVRPFNFKEKVPENWLYINPKQKMEENNLSENPIEWMRTIFDENEIVPESCKSNLKQTLSKSQANLVSPDILEFNDDMPKLFSYKSVSDLKNIEICDNLKKNDEIMNSQYKSKESKTAPGSVENIMEFRSSFQDFIALAKQQEEKLKAEVLKRKNEVNGRMSCQSTRQTPSVRYIKNNRKTVPVNRFGFQDFAPIYNQPKLVTTRYSRQNIKPNNSELLSSFKPKLSLQTTDLSQPLSDKHRNPSANNFRRSIDCKTNIKLYHV